MNENKKNEKITVNIIKSMIQDKRVRHFALLFLNLTSVLKRYRLISLTMPTFLTVTEWAVCIVKHIGART